MSTAPFLLDVDITAEMIAEALRESLPPFDCSRFGEGAYPTPGGDRCARPWVELYDVQCSDEAIACVMFRHEHYHWRRTVRLPALLSRRPRIEASAESKVLWCREMLDTVVALADDTNIPHAFQTGYGVDDHFVRTREYLQRRRPRLRDERVPLIFPELRRTRSGDERIPGNRSAFGFHIMSLLGSRVDHGWWSYLWMPDGRTRSTFNEHVVRAHQLEFPRPIPWNAPPDAVRTRRMDPYDAALLTFENAPGAEDYTYTSLERATGHTACFGVGPDARECHRYERFDVAIAGAEVTMNLLSNHARDWMAAPFSRVVNRGFQRYFTYLEPHLENPNIHLDPEEVSAAVTRAKRAESQAWISSIGGTAGAIAGAINPAVGAVVGVLLLVVSIIVEIAPMAEGGSGCPIMPVRRMLTDASCAPLNPQGNPDIVAGLVNLRADYFVPDAAGEGVPAQHEDDGGSSSKSSSSALPLFGMAAAAAALLGYAVYRSRNEGSSSTDSETP